MSHNVKVLLIRITILLFLFYMQFIFYSFITYSLLYIEETEVILLVKRVCFALLGSLFCVSE